MDGPTILVVAGVFLGTLIASGGAAALVLVRLPADYFVDPHQRPEPASGAAAWRVARRILRNLAGWALVAIGLVLSLPFVPGQGILTVFVGLLLVDFPGRYRLLRRIIRRPRIFRAVNWMRMRFGRKPLEAAKG